MVLLSVQGMDVAGIAKVAFTSEDRVRDVKRARIEYLYALADHEVIPEPGEPEVIFCVDEFGVAESALLRCAIGCA